MMKDEEVVPMMPWYRGFKVCAPFGIRLLQYHRLTYPSIDFREKYQMLETTNSVFLELHRLTMMLLLPFLNCPFECGLVNSKSSWK
jgi:hypothetical protein